MPHTYRPLSKISCELLSLDFSALPDFRVSTTYSSSQLIFTQLIFVVLDPHFFDFGPRFGHFLDPFGLPLGSLWVSHEPGFGSFS